MSKHAQEFLSKLQRWGDGTPPPASYAESKILIHVTDDDIMHGCARDCSNCAIALAVMRTLCNIFNIVDHHWNLEVRVNYGFLQREYLALCPRASEWYWVALLGRDVPAVYDPTTRYPYPDNIIEWAKEFDDWAETEWMETGSPEIIEWNEERGEEEEFLGELPPRPEPMKFILPMEKLQPIEI